MKDIFVKELLRAILGEVCPGMAVSFQGKACEVAEAYPIFMSQALATASVVGGIPGAGVIVNSRTEQRMIDGDTPICLLLPFLLDAVMIARERSRVTHSETPDILQLETITPPISPSINNFRSPPVAAEPVTENIPE